MILVVGAGVAGLSCALAAARAGEEVELATPGALEATEACETAGTPPLSGRGRSRSASEAGRALAGGNTALAQGGIAAAIAPGDTAGRHLADTLAAGGGLADAEAARVLTREGARVVHRLIAEGCPVDRDAAGGPLFCLEAAHGTARIVHAGGDRTGAVLHAFLAERVLDLVEEGRIRLREHRSAVSLLEASDVVTGAVLQGENTDVETVRADAVVLATGGYAALYPRTSNHTGARGQGVVLAARAGALVADLEFIQFHPTVLAGSGQLVSEAVRGAGAVLRDGSGRRFMVPADPAAELAPRDVVSSEIHRVLRRTGEDVVWLDASGVERAGGPGTLARRFPGITAAVSARGLDWRREPIPVAPAAHYTMGGVLSDVDGRSSVPGLFVAGEAAATGVHGANRLASNSLLEGLVFGERAGNAAVAFARSRAWEHRGDGFADLAGAAVSERLPEMRAPEKLDMVSDQVPEEVSRGLAEGLGIERDADGIRDASARFHASAGSAAELAAMIARAATARRESRGAHRRADYPGPPNESGARRAFRFTFSAAPRQCAAHLEHVQRKSLTPC